MDNAAFEGAAQQESAARRRALIHRGHRLQAEEQRFLDAIRNGDILGLRSLLQAHPGLNVNCCDMRGLRALEVCAQNGDVDASVELLRLRALDPDHVQAALLVAVQRGDLMLTKILLDGAHGPCTVPVGNMTPLMAAAIAGDLEITKMLLDRGHVIQKPHEPGCLCAELCREQSQKHGERLSQSQLRRNAFRALSSPVYILLTSDDPVLTAFTLSRDLQRLADSTPEFQNEYREMEAQCSQFAAAIMGACKNSEEVETLLSQTGGFPTTRPFRFPRLSLAILLDQKDFVGHANCQQVLRSLWYNGLPAWPGWTTTRKAVHVTWQALQMPFLCLLYLFTPQPRLLKPLRVPLNRFIHSCASYATFLVLLTMSLFYGRRDSLKLRVLWSEILVGIWVVGYVWELAQSGWALGPRVFLRSWWAVYDVLMYGLFLVAEILWFIVFVTARTLQENLHRDVWPWYHPYLIGESLHAMATVLAFCRLLLWCQMHQSLGPLTVSLRYMLGDVVRFLLILCIVFFAFATGISSIYKNYKGNEAILTNGTTKHQPPNFTTYLESKALFNVHLGSHQRESRDETEVVAKVAHICEHRLSYRTYNDIAILRLKKKVIFNDFIQPVCLPEPSLDDDLPANTTVYATGWGKTTSDMEGPLSDVLKQLQTETMDHDECQGYLKLKLLDSMLCTRHSYGSTCHGDSGGPLVRQTADGAWVLEGVLAGGPPVCGVTSTPMRFTKVSRFVRWIQDYRSRKTRAALENFCKPRAQ
ncbi:hypothetical protein ISCGN_009542 [Ixodes scapularis]